MKTLIRSLLIFTSGTFLASCATTETDRDLFIKADTNKDGTLSLEEVNKAGLPRLFARFDLDSDGHVTLTEARQVEPGFDESLFAQRDLNKDSKVSFGEYEKVAMSKGGLKTQFAEVDTNGDGIISKVEAEAFVAKRDLQAAAQ